MNPPKRLSTQQQAQEQHLPHQQQAHTSAPLEFQNAEELLRHDAQDTVVPDSVAHRLQQSLEHEPAPPRSWWRRFFGR